MKIALQLKRQEEPAPVEMFGRKLPVDTTDKLKGEYDTRKEK